MESMDQFCKIFPGYGLGSWTAPWSRVSIVVRQVEESDPDTDKLVAGETHIHTDEQRSRWSGSWTNI